MKKSDPKANGRLSSVLALVLVTSVVIGLLTSTAGKLAVATYLMKSSQKKVVTNNTGFDNFVNNLIGETEAPTTAAPTTAAPTTAAPTTAAPTTAAPTTTESTTAATETTTQAPTTQAPTEPAETEQTVAEKQEMLKSYTDAVSLVKSSAFTCTKTTSRTLEMDFFTSLLSFIWGDIEGANSDYFTTTTKQIKNGDELCIDNDLAACLLNADSKKVVNQAIKQTSKEELSGNQVKVVIDFNDEANPAPIKATDKSSDSFTAAAFPVVTANQFRVMLDKAQSNSKTELVNINYTGCQIEVIYNPANGEISYIKQTAKYVASVEDGYKKADFTVVEVSEYTDFKY